MAKCPICNDSGKRPGSDYLDCGCTASAERAELNTFAEDQISTSNPEERDCLIYTRAKALGRASALAELHPLWLAEKERADRAEARIAELEAQLAAASAPADTDKLREAILALPLPEAWITDYTTNDPAARLHFAADQVRDLLKSAADLAASTALQAPVREVPGWQLVPIEPTHEMVMAARAKGTASTKAEIWCAMLAASPRPAAPVQQEGA